MNKETKLSRREKGFLIAFFVLGLFARVWNFGSVPPGLNQDEAFAAYDAWALLNHGTDSSMHSWPVYLTAWGSGMNALESYLLIPFFALFGVKTWVIRMPQLILAILALPAAFSVGRDIGGKRCGLICMALLALCPWHILLSRWALESNMAPNLLLIGICIFLKGQKNERFLPVAALLLGLSLYAYSAIWPVLPVLLGLVLLQTRPKPSAWLLFAGLILALAALPLLGFLAVNYGLIGEFSIGPFSVPKLVSMRREEISLSRIPDNLKIMGEILLQQTDGLKWNSPGIFGLFYPAYLPFLAVGTAELVHRLVRPVKNGKPDAAVTLLIWLITGIILTALISVNINRMNYLLMAVAITTAVGAEKVLLLMGRQSRKGCAALLALVLIWFVPFEKYYFTEYAESLRGEFTVGWEEALDAALSREGTIYVTHAIHYPKILLKGEISPEKFNTTVEYETYPAQYLSPKSFDRFVYVNEASIPEDPKGTFILWNGMPNRWSEQEGFQSERYGCFEVLFRE